MLRLREEGENMNHELTGTLMFMIIAGILGLITWVVCLTDVIKSEFENPNNKIIWILLLLLIAPLATLIYIFIGKGQKINAASDTVDRLPIHPERENARNSKNWL